VRLERFARLLELAFGSEAAAGATDHDGLGQLGEPRLTSRATATRR